MTDHRVTDLSHGHPGRATYNTEEREWKFSQTFTGGPSLKQLLPFKQWLAPSYQIATKSEGKASALARDQMRWLRKNLPVSFPASPLISNLVKTSCEAPSDNFNGYGPLLAIGRAYDIDRISGVRRPRILAIPHGAAGHVLRLIKPRVETRGWGKQSAARLNLLNSESLDAGHWVGTGGPIRQITFTDIENETEIWLAVRQDTVTTVFRPTYGRICKPSIPVNGGSTFFAPCLLDPNPVASLTTLRTGSKNHSDVAFNPWFPRQVAIVDSEGYWSIWELEKQHGSKKKEFFKPRKMGGIYDGRVQSGTSRAPTMAHHDGWYRIMWVCNLNTVVVCNRRYLAIFDVEGITTLIGHTDLFATGNKDWVLDIQWSSQNQSHLFVLTTTRIFWLKIVPARDKRDDQDAYPSEIRSIVSYLHFMSPDDETMKLTLLRSQHVSVAITSGKNRVVNYYSFRQDEASSMGTLILLLRLEGNEEELSLPLHTVKFLPCIMVPSASHMSGPGLKYTQEGVEFFQIWAITSNLSLISALSCVTKGRKNFVVVAPETKLLLSHRYRGPKIAIDEDFIVSENETQPFNVKGAGTSISIKYRFETDQTCFTLNWRRIFQSAFMGKFTLSYDTPGFEDLLHSAYSHINQGIENDDFSNSTLFDLVGVPSPGQDLQEASLSINELLASLASEQSSEAQQTLRIRCLTLGLDIGLPEVPDSTRPDLLGIFDQLVEYWMADLPANLPNLARHTKFNAVRQLTLELGLSSIGMSLQCRASSVPVAIQAEDDVFTESMISKNRGIMRDSSPAYSSSQLATVTSGPCLPTSTATPSLYSHGTPVSGLPEDQTIARLRRYAPTIKAKLEIGTRANTSILSHWPPEPGADPEEYSYEATKQAYEVTKAADEDRRSLRKEKARRRRRTEEFVKAVEPAVSRRLSFFSGSQPEMATRTFSSQVVDELPMTQPDRGTFGGRTVPKSTKKAKKLRKAGFK
ncbi:hypothetical protein QTJ16_004927 [Diplocarpon rosae]|uniref:RNA polymerase I-specific transcription initiation factor RRN6-like protein n=1 Tax=Diplocarpon rosae TaxID=946125 RepID=A0AAD9SXS4_9HELO|nr:hypothetical protein QTJ16_004927 [Diplocarpon rosae]